MAVTLSLKAALSLGQGPGVSAAQNPTKHFRTYFQPLYGIAHQAGNPTVAANTIRQFLHGVVHSLEFVQLRLRRYMQARRVVTRFVARAAHARRRRLQASLQQWHLLDANPPPPPGVPATDRPDGGGNAAKKPVPPDVKARVLAALHRDMARGVLVGCGTEIRHRQQLSADLSAVSHRIAALWLGGCPRPTEVQQLVARLVGLRQRLREYTIAPVPTLEAAWRHYGISDWEARLEASCRDDGWRDGFFVDISKLGPLHPRRLERFDERAGKGFDWLLRRKYVDAVSNVTEIEGVPGFLQRLQSATSYSTTHGLRSSTPVSAPRPTDGPDPRPLAASTPRSAAEVLLPAREMSLDGSLRPPKPSGALGSPTLTAPLRRSNSLARSSPAATSRPPPADSANGFPPTEAGIGDAGGQSPTKSGGDRPGSGGAPAPLFAKRSNSLARSPPKLASPRPAALLSSSLSSSPTLLDHLHRRALTLRHSVMLPKGRRDESPATTESGPSSGSSSPQASPSKAFGCWPRGAGLAADDPGAEEYHWGSSFGSASSGGPSDGGSVDSYLAADTPAVAATAMSTTIDPRRRSAAPQQSPAHERFQPPQFTTLATRRHRTLSTDPRDGVAQPPSPSPHRRPSPDGPRTSPLRTSAGGSPLRPPQLRAFRPGRIRPAARRPPTSG
eukprot:EG_transcript_4381